MHKKSRLAIACVFALSAPAAVYAQVSTAAPTPVVGSGNAVAGAAAAPAASASAPAKAAEPESPMQQVIVTASKRRERLQDAPVAITAFTSDTIEKLGIDKFSDYVSLVPNLAQAVGSSPGIGTIIIRGMYTGSQQTTNTSAVYFGESPFSASGSLSVGALVTPDPDLADVERIEVLKGPQGTLFGASSLGGLIRVIPQDPDLSGFSGNFRLGYSAVDGGSDGFAARVSLNIPMSSSFGVRVAAFKRRDGGFVTNVETGDTNLGQSDIEGGSLTALAKLNRDWKVTLRLLSQDTNSDGGAVQDNVQLTGTPVTGKAQFSSFTDDPSSVAYRLAELSSEYTTELGTLTATLSHAQSRVQLQSDYTQPYGPFVAPYLPAGFAVVGDVDINMKAKTSAELRFATKRLGSFEGVAGLFYTDEHNDYDTVISTFLANHTLAPAPLSNFLTSDTVSSYREEAVFANGTYYLTDAVDVGAGVRYAENQQHAVLGSTGLLAGAGASGDFNFRDSATTYQATGRWRPSQDFSTFLRFATGYRPGGPQTNATPPPGAQATLRPDTVSNIELGFKGTALDRHVSYDASVYHTDWKDVQLNGLYGGSLLLANAGRAKIDGFESQVQYNANNGLSAGASVGFNNARLTQVDASTAAVLGAAPGDRLPGSPKVSAALFGDWRFPVGPITTGSIGTTVRYQGDKVSSYPGSALNPSYTMPAYTTLDLRSSLEWDRYTLRLLVENVMDKFGYTGYATNRVLPSQTTIPSNVTITRPRTISVSFGADF
jgi:iron complex outermembrane recepter protein